MNDAFGNILKAAQSVQREYIGFGSLSVTKKYDTYYEEYLEMEFRNNDVKMFLSTMRCVDEDEAMNKIDAFKYQLEELYGNGE